MPEVLSHFIRFPGSIIARHCSLLGSLVKKKDSPPTSSDIGGRIVWLSIHRSGAPILRKQIGAAVLAVLGVEVRQELVERF